jgi:hypothetical protein
MMMNGFATGPDAESECIAGGRRMLLELYQKIGPFFDESTELSI